MRVPRISFAGGMYHITTRCNNREFFFASQQDFELYLQTLRRAKEIYKTQVYAYCITSNHVHLVVATPKKKKTLSQFMQYLNGNFAKAYNKAHGKTGHFWGERFFSTVIESETQFFHSLVYVELNMVRAGVVKDPQEWRWSSYRAHAGGESSPILDKHPLYEELGNNDMERQVAYRAMIGCRIEELGLERDPVLTRGLIAGSRSFVSKVLQRCRHRHEYYRQCQMFEYGDRGCCLLRPSRHLTLRR